MTADVHTLSGAYALDALSPEEAAEFRSHLEGCAACRDEVRELRRAAALMGAAEAEPPPPELKARVLAAADRTPQQPPRLDLRPRERGAQPRRWRTWVAAAAAAVVVAGGAAVTVDALRDDEPVPTAVEQVFEAEDARTATVETANGGRLTVGVSPSRNEMAVDTSGLPDPGEGRVYQIWAVHGTEMVSAAVLDDVEAGAAMGMPEEDTEVALTVEPAGGSEQPTSAPIVQVDPRDV
ncbi:anti-sigma factor [Nocardioides caldifontis]|uniref:anti-sigma factor n=1 Tax=Nocardioides caldifontis TaxID=2588938 RepID=UPI0011E05834|nr:anti-sigma factor [Nocardioides caldifontis]